GRSHEMPTIFFWLSTISQMLLHPYFIFDGPDRPEFQGGNDRASGGPRLLVERFQELLNAFGFGWHTAPGEAEAELACFQSSGLVDVVVTPYNDVLLFGAKSVLRTVLPMSNNYGYMELYTDAAIQHRAFLSWGHLLLIALMNGADYDRGLPGCTVDIAFRMTQYGLGSSLLGAASRLQFAKFMSFHAKWRKELCDMLERDPQRHLGRTYYKLAEVIEKERPEFPNPAVLATYLLPLTSWSDGGQPPITVVTSRQPDLATLSVFCSQCLDWPQDSLHQRLMGARVGAAIHALLQVSHYISTPDICPSHCLF
ncbi:hypothetical protein SCLCIDRAFT_143472, partial [Scleroderma citrinum Foug A]